jgi:uncharacterized membrane protein (UPF0127 family)
VKQPFCAFNISRQAFLSIRVTVADTPLSRLRGLLGKVRLRSDEALWVVPSRGIHTIGLRFPIDVVYLDADMRVIYLVENLQPLSVGAFRLRSASVLQLPARNIYESGTQIGDQLLVCSPDQLDGYWASQRSGARLIEQERGPDQAGQPDSVGSEALRVSWNSVRGFGDYPIGAGVGGFGRPM